MADDWASEFRRLRGQSTQPAAGPSSGNWAADFQSLRNPPQPAGPMFPDAPTMERAPNVVPMMAESSVNTPQTRSIAAAQGQMAPQIGYNPDPPPITPEGATDVRRAGAVAALPDPQRDRLAKTATGADLQGRPYGPAGPVPLPSEPGYGEHVADMARAELLSHVVDVMAGIPARLLGIDQPTIASNLPPAQTGREAAIRGGYAGLGNVISMVVPSLSRVAMGVGGRVGGRLAGAVASRAGAGQEAVKSAAGAGSFIGGISGFTAPGALGGVVSGRSGPGNAAAEIAGSAPGLIRDLSTLPVQIGDTLSRAYQTGSPEDIRAAADAISSGLTQGVLGYQAYREHVGQLEAFAKAKAADNAGFIATLRGTMPEGQRRKPVPVTPTQGGPGPRPLQIQGQIAERPNYAPGTEVPIEAQQPAPKPPPINLRAGGLPFMRSAGAPGSLPVESKGVEPYSLGESNTIPLEPSEPQFKKPPLPLALTMQAGGLPFLRPTAKPPGQQPGSLPLETEYPLQPPGALPPADTGPARDMIVPGKKVRKAGVSSVQPKPARGPSANTENDRNVSLQRPDIRNDAGRDIRSVQGATPVPSTPPPPFLRPAAAAGSLTDARTEATPVSERPAPAAVPPIRRAAPANQQVERRGGAGVQARGRMLPVAGPPEGQQPSTGTEQPVAPPQVNTGGGVETRPGRRDQIKNNIEEGMLILKTGQFNGRTKSPEQIEQVRRGVVNAKARLGLPVDATIEQVRMAEPPSKGAQTAPGTARERQGPAGVAGAAPKPETGAKRQAWQMPRAEFVEEYKRQYFERHPEKAELAKEAGSLAMDTGPDPISLHRSEVRKAIRSGEKVPPSVLAEYPDLKPKGDSPTTLHARILPLGLVPGTGKAVSAAFSKAVDTAPGRAIQGWIDDWTGRSAPRITRSNREAGEAVARHASASVAALPIARAYAMEVMGPKFKDTKFRDQLGAVLTEDNLRSVKAGFIKAGEPQAAAGVHSLIGAKDSPFKTEAEYQKALQDPDIKAAIKRHISGPMAEIEGLYRSIQNIDPQAVLPDRGETTGARINLKPIIEGEPVDPGARTVGGGRGNILNPFKRRSPFARQATGGGESYDINYENILGRSLSEQLGLATKNRAYDALVKAGDAKELKPGEKAPTLKNEATKALPIQRRGIGGQTENRELWVRQSLYPELRRALNIDEPTRGGLLGGLANVSNKLALASLTEASIHGTNLLTAVVNTPGIAESPAGKALSATGGFGNLGIALTKITSRFAAAVKADPQTVRQIADLAQIGAFRAPHANSNVMGRFLQRLDTSVRLVMDDAFTGLAKKGLVENTETNRREFVNRVGQYNRRLQPKLVQILRDTGVAPFATAGTTFLREGLRRVTASPGVKATDTASAAKLRASQLSRVLGSLILTPAIVNYCTTGNPTGRKGTPLGAIDTGKDDDEGKPLILDIQQLFGTRRGLRATGLNAVIEGTRAGLDKSQIMDDAMADIGNALLRPGMGPIVEFGVTAATGKSASLKPQQLAEVVPPGQSQRWANIKAAGWRANPLAEAGHAYSSKKSGLSFLQSQFPAIVPRTGMSEGAYERMPAGRRAAQSADYLDWVFSEAKRRPGADQIPFIRDRLRQLSREDLQKFEPTIRRKMLGWAIGKAQDRRKKAAR